MRILLKESIVSIKRNFKRFISILLIVLLGVGFFAGIKVASPDMKKTINSYYNDTNFMDFNLFSTWGVKDTDVKTFEEYGYNVEATYEFDAIVEGEIEEVVKIISYNKNSKINNIILLDGRLPTEPNECLIEQSEYTESYKIGDRIIVKSNHLNKKELTVVGIIKSPIYISLERGTTTLLSGKISYFMYVPTENFDMECYTNLYVKLSSKDRDIFSKEYKKLLNNEKENIQEITKTLTEKRYTKEKIEAFEKIKKQEEKLTSEKTKFNESIKKETDKINSSKESYNRGIKELNFQIKKTEREFENALAQIRASKKELNENKSVLFSKEKELSINKGNLKSLNTTYKTLKEDYDSVEINQKNLLIQKKDLENLISNSIEVEENTKLLEEVEKNVVSLEAQKKQIEYELNELSTNVTKYQKEITQAEKIISISKKQLQQAEQKLISSQKELDNNYNLFNKEVVFSKKKLQTIYEQIKNGEKELSSNKKKAEDEFARAENKIIDAKKEIEKLEEPIWYILDHNNNIGFYQYRQDAERIEKIGQVFPFVFFIVSILICLTSMTRMVEEERNQLGTLKALGYSNIQIISKYIIYVLLATIIGSVFGVLIGMKVIPYIIINMYVLIYTIGEPILLFDLKYALTGTVIALVCILLATLLACYKELQTEPATLMRSKSPKVGKRVLLERMAFIWSRLTFTRKVTVRNVFRYKKRFLMTIIGIAGCTGLIIAGFGLRDCITNMVPMQYGEIFNYQIEVTFRDNISVKDKDIETERIKTIEKINKVIKVKKEAVTIENKRTNQSVQLVIPFDDLNNFINLKNRKTGESYSLNNDGIITEKLAELLDIKAGEEFVIKTDKEYSFKIGNITENYFDHFIYLDKKIYNSNDYNTLLIKTDVLTDIDEKIIAQELRKNDLVASVTYTSSMMGIFDKTMENFGLVAVVLIVSAGLLAFVVLYNLASVNISERKRELATIKVLGFYDKEVYNYIGRETTILTTIGMIFGILLGKILTVYILKTCELDSVMFNTSISLSSYVYSLLITVIFTLLVNITTYFALKKIDMIESLKSVE